MRLKYMNDGGVARCITAFHGFLGFLVPTTPPEKGLFNRLVPSRVWLPKYPLPRC